MLKRTPLVRRKRLVWRPRRTAYARRERDFDYMLAVKELPCALAGVAEAGPCSGPIEADHMGERGLGQKAPDNTCGPLCSGHHRDRTDGCGYFNRPREENRHWCRLTIARTQHAIAEKRAGARPERTP